jgi:heptosyltransferase-3
VDVEALARRRRVPLRILITRLRYLGDVILSTPAVAAVKARYPEAEIWYLAERPYAEILQGNPHLAGIISLTKGFRGTVAALAALRGKRFTAAIDLLYNPRSAWLLFLTGIPVRVGGSRRGRARFYTHRFTAPPGMRSAVAHHLAAVAAIDVRGEETLPRVYLSPEERAAGRAIVRASFPEGAGGRVIALHPGGTWPSKRWPPVSFAALAGMLGERLGARVLIITGPNEAAIADEVRRGSRAETAALPLLPIRTAAAVLDACDAVVANDGGILHLAVALRRPTVGVFGPTEPEIWFPYEGRGPFALVTRREECAPCHLHTCDELDCLRRIEPREVLARVEGVLAGRSAA